MYNALCSRCGKRAAIIFVSREVNGKPKTEGLCFFCAKELNIPQIKEIAEKVGIDDLDNIGKMMGLFGGDGFEPVGGGMFNPFLANFQGKNLFGGENLPGFVTGNAESQKKDEKTKFRYLDAFGINLTEKARRNELDRVIGREKEIYRVIQILSRRSKNNPCLIGEPGVGKTAIAEGIAQKIANGDVPYKLLNKTVYLIDMTALIAGTQFRGQFESRIRGLVAEIKKAGNIIPFIDEVHTLIGTGDSEGSMSAANILKPALSRGEIQLIGATTFKEYRKYIENDSALERRFQSIHVNEPNITETVKILEGIRSYYEQFHKVKITNSIIYDAVVLSERYISERFLPDKAIDLLDEACVCRALQSPDIVKYEKLLDLRKGLLQTEKKLKDDQEPDYKSIAEVRSKISKVDGDIENLDMILSGIFVKNSDLAKVVELWTGIPAAKIEQSEVLKLRNIEKEIKSKIIGQDEAVELVAKAVRRHRVKLSKECHPASFIFVGPTGVGKTELVKVLADYLFDGMDNLIRLDMSEYMEKYAVSRMIGSPPGYVGYDDAGQLTEKIRRRPYSVILFDEIEKAHPDVMNILLQILDEGKITDSHGRVVNFENTIIVMTSNAGSSDKSGIVGFDKTDNQISREKAINALEQFLRPEFMGRIDEIVVFNRLSVENLKSIARLTLDEFKDSMRERNIKFIYDDKLVDCLVGSLGNGKYGARDLNTEIRRKVEELIVNLFIDSNSSLDEIFVSANGQEVVLC